MSNKVYGIDLGTTYSAIAYIDEYGKATIIKNNEGDAITPSVVFFDSDGNTLVGKIAKESAKTDPDRVTDFVKRQMSNKDWTFSIDGKTYKPEEISSFILKRIATDASRTGEHEIKDVVITCPAYFGDLERKRTRDAGELAGLNVVAILDEPVAAALNYGLNADNRGKTIIVYDLGGGTFDVTVVRIGADGSVEVVCTEGNHQLGGFDWDKKIVDYYISQFQSETGNTGNLLEDPDTAYELRLGAETDKKTLSLKGSVKRKVAFDGDKAIVELTREKFDELMVDLLEKTIVLTDSVLAQIQAKGIKVDTWLLVGGSTRMPQVKDKLCAKYGLTFGENLLEFDVDEAVAKGAAKFGEKSVIITKIGDKIEEKLGGDKKFEDLDKNEQDKVVEEVAEEMGKTKEEIFTLATTSISTVASKSYGIRVLNSQDKPVVYNLIVKQTPIPKEGKEGKQTFRTKGANADSLDLVVYVNNENGQDVEIAVSQELGNAELKLEGNLPEGSPIEIIFNLDEQGKLTLKGIDKTYGKSVEAVFQSDGVMSESEKKIALEKSKDIKVQ